MNQRVKQLLAISLLTGAIFTAPSYAQTQQAKAPSTEVKGQKPVRIPFSGKLGTVDKTTMNITLDGKTKKRTIRVTPQTKIMKAGKSASLLDAVIGEEVGGQAIKNAEGEEEAITLRLGAKPEAAPKQKKRDKEEPAATK